MSGNVVSLLPRTAQNDTFLSEEVQGIRRICGSQFETHTVAIVPLLDDYEPFIFPNGAMQLGAAGVNSFAETFSSEGINTNQLLVIYSALKHELFERRKQSPKFHNLLGELTVRCAQGYTFPAQGADTHKREDIVIGYTAARCAQMRAALRLPTRAKRQYSPAWFMFAAEKAGRARSAGSHKAQRRIVMRDFSLDLPKIEPQIAEIITAASAQ